jgi:dTMP kinase
MRGKFVVFEGLDGSGKSLCIASIEKKLYETAAEFYITKEPTDGIFGALIHQYMTGRLDYDTATLAAMFLADRLDHLNNPVNGLLGILDRVPLVLCDRYYFSSYAYHAVHVDMDWVIAANKICAGLLRADITFFIDTPPEVCMERIRQNRGVIEKFEYLENLKQARENYYRAFDKLKDSENVVIINGERPPETIFAEVWNLLQPQLQLQM